MAQQGAVEVAVFLVEDEAIQPDALWVGELPALPCVGQAMRLRKPSRVAGDRREGDYRVVDVQWRLGLSHEPGEGSSDSAVKEVVLPVHIHVALDGYRR